MKQQSYGSLFVMIAASLWAIDALFRTELTKTIPTASIVFFEHLLGFIFLILLQFKVITHKNSKGRYSLIQKIKNLETADWIKLISLTIVSSALGALLFTEALNRSFAQGDFLTPLILQKMQPVFVIILSALFLKERINFKFVLLALIAMIGSYMVGFGTEVVKLQLAGKELVFVLAIGATLAWGSGTILSKSILKKFEFGEATLIRFALAIPVTFLFTIGLNQTYDFTSLSFDQFWRFAVIAGITGGAGAVMLYYKGLKAVEAKVATIAELAFPVTALLIAISSLNPYGAPQQLSLANIFGVIILITSILLITLPKEK